MVVENTSVPHLLICSKVYLCYHLYRQTSITGLYCCELFSQKYVFQVPKYVKPYVADFTHCSGVLIVEC